jgi:hypothetical protein
MRKTISRISYNNSNYSFTRNGHRFIVTQNWKNQYNDETQSEKRHYTSFEDALAHYRIAMSVRRDMLLEKSMTEDAALFDAERDKAEKYVANLTTHATQETKG